MSGADGDIFQNALEFQNEPGGGSSLQEHPLRSGGDRDDFGMMSSFRPGVRALCRSLPSDQVSKF